MPIFVLYAKAELEGVARLTFPFPTCQWKFDVQQSAGSETREGVVMDPEEEIELAETRNGMANFVSTERLHMQLTRPRSSAICARISPAPGPARVACRMFPRR